MNIYVGNLPYTVRDDELRQTFEAFGSVASAQVIIDKRSKRSRGYGFVEMNDDNEGRAAIEALNGSELGGRSLRVDESKPKSETEEHGRSNNQQDRNRRPRSNTQNVQQESGGIVSFFKKLFR